MLEQQTVVGQGTLTSCAMQVPYRYGDGQDTEWMPAGWWPLPALGPAESWVHVQPVIVPVRLLPWHTEGTALMPTGHAHSPSWALQTPIFL